MKQIVPILKTVKLLKLIQTDTGGAFVYVDPCDESIEDDIISACEAAQTANSDCCSSVQSICNTLLDTCKLDACAAADGDATQIDTVVDEFFTMPLQEACNHSEAFDPVSSTGECAADVIHTFNWDTLTEEGEDIPQYADLTFYVNETDLSLNIYVELEYLGAATADNEDEANWGVTYVLDFEDFDAHKMDIIQPGTCQNRNSSAFSDATLEWEDYWSYSLSPFDDIGSIEYLAYPPPDPVYGEWDVYMKEYEECETVVYQGKFRWEELRNCQDYGETTQYTSIETDDEWMNLTGTFYINVVSPFWYALIMDIGFINYYHNHLLRLYRM